MNSLYFIVEGSQTEPIVYKAWLPLLTGRAKLSRPEDAALQSGFYIIAGFGYPNLLNRIKSAIEDIREFPGFSRLIVSMDSEERTQEEVMNEITTHVQKLNCPIEHEIIISECCIETWFLGNHKFVKRNPSGPLLAFKNEFDVIENDPELMPNKRDDAFNTRAQYHKAYLKAACLERNESYSERNPRIALSKNYLETLIARSKMDLSPNHLRTFARMHQILTQLRIDDISLDTGRS